MNHYCKRCGAFRNDTEYIEGEGHVCPSCELGAEKPHKVDNLAHAEHRWSEIRDYGKPREPECER